MENRETYDDSYRTYEIAEGIFWVGFADRHAGFSNNPYLVLAGSEARRCRSDEERGQEPLVYGKGS